MKYVYNNKTGVWDLRHDDAPKPKEQQRDLVEDENGESDTGEPSGIEIPDYVPDSFRDDAELRAVIDEGAKTVAGEYGTGEVQRVVDLIAQFELELGHDGQPPLWNEEAIRGVLKQRWGTVYQERLAQLQQFVQDRPKLLEYLNRTGLGNSISVCEALALVADGTMSINATRAAELLEASRKDRRSDLRNAMDPQHLLAVARARTLADVIDRTEKNTAKAAERAAAKKDGGRSEQQAMKRGIEAHQAARGNDPKATPDQHRLDDEIRQIRLDKGYSNSSAPNHKQLVARMKELYRLRYPEGK
jgi:hypothetical protein